MQEPGHVDSDAARVVDSIVDKDAAVNIVNTDVDK
jgi:hypothetical protein